MSQKERLGFFKILFSPLSTNVLLQHVSNAIKNEALVIEILKEGRSEGAKYTQLEGRTNEHNAR